MSFLKGIKTREELDQEEKQSLVSRIAASLITAAAVATRGNGTA